MSELGRMLLILGVVLALAGVVLLLGDKLPLRELWERFPLGRLPGDIHIRREGFSFSFPVVTCLILSVVLTLIFSLFRR